MERDIAGAWRQQRASEIWPSDVLLRLWPQHKVLLGLQVHIFHMCECMHLHPDKGCCLPAYIWTIASRQTRLKTMMGGMLTEFTFYCPMGTSLLVRSCLQVCSPARTKHRSAYNLHCVLFFFAFLCQGVPISARRALEDARRCHPTCWVSALRAVACSLFSLPFVYLRYSSSFCSVSRARALCACCCARANTCTYTDEHKHDHTQMHTQAQLEVRGGSTGPGQNSGTGALAYTRCVCAPNRLNASAYR